MAPPVNVVHQYDKVQKCLCVHEKESDNMVIRAERQTGSLGQRAFCMFKSSLTRETWMQEEQKGKDAISQ
jgi:hypothetical protein